MTLANSQTLHHPKGVRVTTPLLVPSFSSKGFGATSDGESEIAKVFSVMEEYLTEAMLISAFDLHHGNLPVPESAITEVTFVDSGGYEISDIYDFSTKYRQPLSREEAADSWSEGDLRAVYDGWPEGIPAAFVSFDHPKVRRSLKDQIQSARDLLCRYQQLRVLLVKPETTDQVKVQVRNIVVHSEELGYFDIVGFTENELGNSLLKRMMAIAKIRLALDDEGVETPIHVFGGLDPVSCALYYCAGAEIFDGLTWLRYGYMNGLAVYHHNYAASAVGIDRTDWFARVKATQDNIDTLIDLRNTMRKFSRTGDFGHFGKNEAVIRDAFELLCTRIGRL